MPRRPPRLASVSPGAVLLACLPFAALATNPANDAAGFANTINYTGEAFADISGGKRRGGVFTGLLQDSIAWRAGSWAAHSDVYFPHGDSLSRHDVGDFSVVSNIDAVHQLRLHELWLQRTFGHASLRVGLVAADTEFWGSDTASVFISSAFGAPSVISGNLPHPPIFPQGVLGVRGDWALNKADTLRIAVLNGDGGDPASANRHGLRLNLDRGALLLIEQQHRFGAANAPTGTARFGAFFHSDAVLNEGGRARGNWGLVGLIDHKVTERLTWFGRAGIARKDRSTVPWSVETGLNLSGVIAERNTLGIGVAYVDLNTPTRQQVDAPILRHEIIVETTLTIPINKQVALQPDLQYVVDPGGTAKAKDAIVIGLRVNWTPRR
jgi:porin